MSRARSSRRQRSKLNQRLALVLVLLVAVLSLIHISEPTRRS